MPHLASSQLLPLVTLWAVPYDFLYFSSHVFDFLDGFYWFFWLFGFSSVFLSFRQKIDSFASCLSETKKTFSFLFPSARGMNLLSREQQICFHERHGRASQKRKKYFLFFPYTRGTVLHPRQARLCFHKRHGRASRK